MNAVILNGTTLSERIIANLKSRADSIVKKRGKTPCLAVVSVNPSPAAKSYTKNQMKACREAGIEVHLREFPASAKDSDISETLKKEGKDPRVDGILIETPLPAHLQLSDLLNDLPLEKDVEGLSPRNYGRLFAAKSMKEIKTSHVFIPPTASAVITLLKESGVTAAGKEAVILGRSTIVGRPTAHLLSCLDATVTLCHSRTAILTQHLKRSDIVVTAMGRPHSVSGKDLKPGSVVIDAGISYENKKLCGDVDFESAQAVAGFITPVPGGVGPVTTAMLLSNVISAAEHK